MLGIELLGHATTVLKFDELTVLCDPHVHQQFGNGLFTYYPSRRINLKELHRPDAIFISHSHVDHFDLKSLNEFSKDTPIFCPNDYKILEALNYLRFEQITTVSDWTIISPVPDLKIIWTPSLLPISENGILFIYKGISVLSLVDSFVNNKILEEIKSHLGNRKLDFLLLSMQPSQEIEITSGVSPHEQRESIEVLTKEIFETLKPRFVIPYADGQYHAESVSWLNHFRYPVGEEEFKEELSRYEFLTPIMISTGQGITYSTKGIEVNDLHYIELTKDEQNRFYFPSRGIMPLLSTSNDNAGFNSLMDKIKTLSKVDLLSQAKYLHTIECQYKFNILSKNQSNKILFTVLEGGHLSLADSVNWDLPLIEFCITDEELLMLIEGKCEYMSILQAGRIREYRIGVTEDIVILSNDFYSGSERNALVGGIFMFNLIVSQLYEIPFVFEKPSLNDQILNIPSSNCKLLPEQNLHENDEVWKTFIDLMVYSRQNYSSYEGLYLGFSELENWPENDKNDSEGILFPYIIFEKQPHIGFGIIHPDALVERVLSNIIKTGIRNWTLHDSETFHYAPEWRKRSLIPYNLVRLKHLLSLEGIELKIPAKLKPQCQEWWLGVPRIKKLGQAKKISVKLEVGELCGVVNHGFSQNYDFKLEVDAKCKSMNDALVNGSYRFALTLSDANIEKYSHLGFEYLSKTVLIESLKLYFR